jgi:hypothetical protein
MNSEYTFQFLFVICFVALVFSFLVKAVSFIGFLLIASIVTGLLWWAERLKRKDDEDNDDDDNDGDGYRYVA